MASTLRRRLTATATHAAVAAAIFSALSLPALAQQSTAAPAMATAPAASTATAAPETHRGHGMQHRKHHGERAAKRMEQLKGKLVLTTAQEPAWSSFTTAMQPGERPARLDHKDMASLTAPERIDRMRAMRAQHAAEADRRGEATKTFYAALTPEQQKTFDAQAHRGRGGWGGKEGKGGEHHYERHGDHASKGGKGGHHGMQAAHGQRAPAPAPVTAPAPAESAK